MKIFKSWKSEFKKKGAMALTAFMLCGSFSTAFAQDENITINSTNADSGSDGTKKTVTGYQTAIDNVYAANVTWGDMVFIYDRGQFSEQDGTLSPTTGLPLTGIEMGGDNTKIRQWYGFNGTNNLVEIENISREDVMLTAEASEETALNNNDQGMVFSLYAEEGSYEQDYEWSGTSTVTKKVAHDEDGAITFVQNSTSTKQISKLMQRRVFNDAGSEANSTDPDDKVLIYLNITGDPGESVKEYSNSLTDGTTLGNITLSFKTADNTTTINPEAPTT